jgi:signal peptidase I
LKPRRSDIKAYFTIISPDTQVKPALFTKKGEELSLSSQQLQELLRGVLDKGASFRFRATGFSMSPFIKDGDVLTIAPVQRSAPRLGDVVVFTHPLTKKLIIHRVIKKRAGFYLTKGDNVPEGDDLISKADILGLVTKVERNGKVISLGLGLDRFVITFLTRRGLLPLLRPVWRLVRLIVRSRPGE